MSIQAVSWALDQDVADSAAKLVLISLANALNGKTGKCYPSFEQIMKESSTSRSTVIRKLKWLEEHRWIIIHREYAHDGRQLANSYSLNLEGVNLTRGGVTVTPGGVKGDTGEGVSCDTPYKEPEEIPEDSLKDTDVSSKLDVRAKAKREIETEFQDIFWPAYPNKVGKPKALTSFIKARGKNGLPDIMAGLRRYVETKPPDRQWLNPTTFLNQERWNDQPAEPTTGTAYASASNNQSKSSQIVAEMRRITAGRDFAENW